MQQSRIFFFYRDFSSSSGNKRKSMNSINSTNKFIKYNNGSKSLGTFFIYSLDIRLLQASFVTDSDDETYQVHHEREKTFYELTPVPIQIPPCSPTSAVRSIVINCLKEIQPTPPVVNKRVRSERQYGEEITAGGLLQELKDKRATKDAQLKQPRRAAKKLKVKL